MAGGLANGLDTDGFVREAHKLTITELLNLPSGIELSFGGILGPNFHYEEADANARVLVMELPSSGNDVPVVPVGIGLDGVDLGMFNGFDQPMIPIIDADRDSYVGYHFSADDVAVVEMRLGSAGTVRQHTIPDVASDTFTLNAATQTLTNKTLTSPTLTTPTVKNTTDGASVQVVIIEGDRATPADGDEAYITFRLSDSAGNQDEGARITWKATTVLSGATQDTDLIFSALVNNTLTEFMRLDGSANDLSILATRTLISGTITGTAENNRIYIKADWNLATADNGTGDMNGLYVEARPASSGGGGWTGSPFGATVAGIHAIFAPVRAQSGTTTWGVSYYAGEASENAATLTNYIGFLSRAGSGGAGQTTTRENVYHFWAAEDAGGALSGYQHGLYIEGLTGGTQNSQITLINGTTAPSTLADSVQIWAADVSAGQAALYVQDEPGMRYRLGGYGALFDGAASTNNMTLKVHNTSNAAAASHAIIDVSVGGTTSTGSPQVRWTIPSGTSWYAAPNNADEDVFYLGTATTLGSNAYMRLDPRTTTKGTELFSLLFAPPTMTLASASDAILYGVVVPSQTVNYTGTTQVTDLVGQVRLYNWTVAGDTATLTVNATATLTVQAWTKGTNVTLTDNAAIRILNTATSGTNQYGLYIGDLTGGTNDYGIYIAGADTAAIYVASADPIHVGLAGTATGKMEWSGATSGTVTLTVAAAAGTWTLTLPPDDGDVGEQLQTDGNGVTTWEAAASYREAKILMGLLDPREALTKIVALPKRLWKYNPEYRGVGGDYETVFAGAVADEAPWVMKHRGRIFNEINAFGYAAAAIQALEEEILDLGAQVQALQAQAA